jgi:hypothetical protein
MYHGIASREIGVQIHGMQSRDTFLKNKRSQIIIHQR